MPHAPLEPRPASRDAPAVQPAHPEAAGVPAAAAVPALPLFLSARAGSRPAPPPPGDDRGPEAVAAAVFAASAAQPLDAETRGAMESGFGSGFGSVRVHAGPAAAEGAERLGANAFAMGQDIAFGAGRYAPRTPEGTRLLAHELAHVVQARGGSAPGAAPAANPEAEARGAADRVAAGDAAGPIGSAPAVVRRDEIEIDVVGPVDQYRHPAGRVFRVGESAGPNLLMRIVQEADGRVTFHWYNFAAAEPRSGLAENWETMRLAGGFSPDAAAFAQVAAQLGPGQLRGMWPDPIPALLRMNEEGTIRLPDPAVLTTYRGMIYSEAERALNENERQIDELLASGDRVQRIRKFAEDLREASIVRDALEARRNQLMGEFPESVDLPGRREGMEGSTDVARMRAASSELPVVLDAIRIWYDRFQLLQRLRTPEIHPARVEAELRTIKANILSTREQVRQAQVGRGSMDLFSLDAVRARLAGQLGPRATAVVAEEQASRDRWSWFTGGATLAAGVALAFVPGGLFINAAVGVAIAAKSWNEAAVIGAAANTDLDADTALMSSSAEDMAVIGQVLATAGAVLGAGAAGLRIVRTARAFAHVRAVAPEMDFAGQAGLARLAGAHPELLAARSLTEVDQMLLNLRRTVPFDQLQALRLAAYRARGATPPPLSREGLEEFLEHVWQNREALARDAMARDAGNAYQAVYNQYSAAAPVTGTHTARQGLEEVAQIAAGRSEGYSVFQARGVDPAAGRNQVTSAVSAAPAGSAASAELENTFVHFIRQPRPGVTPAPVTERIYLRVHPDEATAIMRRLVNEVVDAPAAFPGVHSAKMAGPGVAGARPDTIVIGLESAQARDAVLSFIRPLQRANPRAFVRGTPAMTEPVMEGVSIGAEPPPGSGALFPRGSPSFGNVRAHAITQALMEVGPAGTRDAFIRRAMELLRARGVNPDLPHQNLPAPPAAPAP